MASVHRITFWNAATEEALPMPEQWCLTRERGWIRVDDVAALIRNVAQQNADISVGDYEKVFRLTMSSLAGSAETGDISQEMASAMVDQIKAFFVRQ